MFHEVALSGHITLDGGLRDTLVEVEGTCRCAARPGKARRPGKGGWLTKGGSYEG